METKGPPPLKKNKEYALQDKITNLLIQSSLKTPLRAFALRPGGSTHRIGGWFLSDSPDIRAKPEV